MTLFVCRGWRLEYSALCGGAFLLGRCGLAGGVVVVGEARRPVGKPRRRHPLAGVGVAVRDGAKLCGIQLHCNADNDWSEPRGAAGMARGCIGRSWRGGTRVWCRW